MPNRPVPDAQAKAFGLAVCKRLGLDPGIVSENMSWSVTGDDPMSPVTLTVYLPPDEVLAMFNGDQPA